MYSRDRRPAARQVLQAPPQELGRPREPLPAHQDAAEAPQEAGGDGKKGKTREKYIANVWLVYGKKCEKMRRNHY